MAINGYNPHTPSFGPPPAQVEWKLLHGFAHFAKAHTPQPRVWFANGVVSFYPPVGVGD